MEIAEYENGSLARRYIPGHSVDQRVAKIENDGSDTTHFYHANRLGSVQAVVNASGVVTDKYIYTPFGVQEIYAESDINKPSGNPFRYTGRRYDVESGLYYYRARYYDSELGRFLETDPVGYADQMNIYSYAYNDPLGFVDPLGREGQPVEEFWKGVGSWSRDAGYFIGNRLFVPLAKNHFDSQLYAEWELSVTLSDSIFKFGKDNWEVLAPIALEKIIENGEGRARLAGRMAAGIAVGMHTGKAFSKPGSAALGISVTTKGQIDRFSASVISQDFSEPVTLDASAETIIGAFFDKAGLQPTFTENEDGSVTLSVTADTAVTGTRIKKTHKVGTFKRKEDD